MMNKVKKRSFLVVAFMLIFTVVSFSNETKQSLGKTSLENWFGLTAPKLRQQVKGTKNIYITGENGKKKLYGLEKNERWFGMTGKTVYEFVTEEFYSGWEVGELTQIVITYNNFSYDKVTANMTKTLGVDPVITIFDDGDSSTTYYKNNLRYIVKSDEKSIVVVIQYDAN